MADDPINQRAFAEDVAAAAEAGGAEGFSNPGGFEMPSPEEIWRIVQSMDGISDEEREELRENIFNPPTSADDFYKRMAARPSHSSREYMVFFVMLAIILVVFALFGYKLYKSLTEKELRRQEKLKGKQQKKTKKSN